MLPNVDFSMSFLIEVAKWVVMYAARLLKSANEICEFSKGW